ncbi:MAG: hypothetical protein DI628_07700 [Blastochloris viridis]|uniref:Uncharacterized protein n=1 Tax=Blastochloris viridis TaxID=1079 RepID=A0A6N4R9I7_BLAVI|nr:MAG: hypothetical protein DI628_07700 [Blastochloris viridis]
MKNSSDFQHDLFLSIAPNMVVYNHLKEAYSQATSSWDFKGVSEKLVEVLLKKKDDLITLGIASFTPYSEILEKLYKSGNKTVKNAILTNKFALGPLTTHILEENVKEIMDDTDLAVAVLLNESFSGTELEEFMLHEKTFKVVSDKRWLELLEVALNNPNVAPPDSFKYGPDDGWGHYTDRLPHRALTKLLLTLPLEKNLRLVKQIIYKIKELDSLAIPQKDEDRTKFKTKYTDFPVLEALLERWPQGKDWDALKTELVGKGQYHDQDVVDFVANNHDVTIRCGYYYFFRPLKASEIRACYKKDGEKFLRAAVNNPTLYNAYQGKPTERALALYKLIQEHIETESEEYQPTIQEEWNWAAISHYRRNPNNFINPDGDWEDDHSVASENHKSSSFGDILEELTSTTASLRENSSDVQVKINDLQAQILREMAQLIFKMQSNNQDSLKSLVERNYKLTKWVGFGLAVFVGWFFFK